MKTLRIILWFHFARTPNTFLKAFVILYIYNLELSFDSYREHQIHSKSSLQWSLPIEFLPMEFASHCPVSHQNLPEDP